MSPRRETPSNGDLAEGLFSLADAEEHGDRRLAFLKAGYAAFDAEGPAQARVLDSAPPWLRPLVAQLGACPGKGAIEAAVDRLSSGKRSNRGRLRSNYLSRENVGNTLAEADESLRPERMRGSVHWHTEDSDGKVSLDVMARACHRIGYSWAVVSDHSRGLAVASGLDREGVRLQRGRLDRWNRQHGDELRLFHGLEVEILEDGTIDVPAADRKELDIVLAAVHRDFDPDRDQTERLLRAVATPGVDVLAHPRARHFSQRIGLRARWETVFAACAEEEVAVEVNGFPRRQDLDWDLCRLAAACGCTFVLASDAHAPNHLGFDAFACAIAARAGLTADLILNSKRAEVVGDWLEMRRV